MKHFADRVDSKKPLVTFLTNIWINFSGQISVKLPDKAPFNIQLGVADLLN